jgi:hypothetical protein
VEPDEICDHGVQDGTAWQLTAAEVAASPLSDTKFSPVIFFPFPATLPESPACGAEADDPLQVNAFFDAPSFGAFAGPPTARPSGGENLRICKNPAAQQQSLLDAQRRAAAEFSIPIQSVETYARPTMRSGVPTGTTRCWR